MFTLVSTSSSLAAFRQSTNITPGSLLTCRIKPLDVECMKRLGTRVNLIPVVAKADTMTPEDLENFKIRVRLRLSGCSPS